MSGKPQGRKPRGRTEASAGAMGYGDLNGGAGPGELDSGPDAGATAPGVQDRCGRSRILATLVWNLPPVSVDR